jgi:hypothetical protein
MAACFQQHMSAPAIAALIKERTGEEVAERTVGRRKAEWEEEFERRQRGREQMEDLLAAARAGDHTAAEMVNALAIEQLMRDPEGTLTADPIKLQEASIKAEKVRLAARSLDLKEREIAIAEKKFAILQAEREKAIAATEELKNKVGSGKQLTLDDMRKIREVYGLSE